MKDTLTKFYYNNGLEKAQGNNIKYAVENLSKSVSYDSSNMEAWNLLGVCFYRIGSFKMAQYCWEQSQMNCKNSSNNSNNSNNPAILYQEKLSKKLLEVNPVFEKVQSLSSNKKYSKAIILLEKEVLPQLKDCAEIYNYLGVLQQLVGKKQRAIKQWETALKLDISNEKATQYMFDSMRKNKHKTIGNKILLLFSKEREANESIL